MQRSVFIMVFLIFIGIVAAVALMQATNRDVPLSVPETLSTATETVCLLLDDTGAPNLKQAMAVENLYQQMPMFKTPVALVATPEKPLGAGCRAAGD